VNDFSWIQISIVADEVSRDPPNLACLMVPHCENPEELRERAVLRRSRVKRVAHDPLGFL
jgi:hypothetical protein